MTEVEEFHNELRQVHIKKQKEEFLKVFEELHEVIKFRFECYQKNECDNTMFVKDDVLRKIDEAKAKFRLTTNNKGEKRCLKN